MSTFNYRRLYRYLYLSILAAVATIFLKTLAYLLTNSMGLLSDALESIVNLVAAVIALVMLRLASKPPDEDHAYGHSKAEYFSSIVEGTLILVAAFSIIWAAAGRLLRPQELNQPFLGLAISLVAGLINFLVARVLIKEGKKHRSITLEADGKHLLTDVWTSIGVLLALILTVLTGLKILDPLIAFGVAANIIFSGFSLIKKSLLGFMDTAVSRSDRRKIEAILKKFKAAGIVFHSLRTRQSGIRRFMSIHILVPGGWSVQQGHDFSEKFERAIRRQIKNITIDTHLEPVEDKKSWLDTKLDR